MYDIKFYISILKLTITKCRTFYIILAHALKVYAILFFYSADFAAIDHTTVSLRVQTWLWVYNINYFN